MRNFKPALLALEAEDNEPRIDANQEKQLDRAKTSNHEVKRISMYAGCKNLR